LCVYLALYIKDKPEFYMKIRIVTHTQHTPFRARELFS